MYVYHTHTQKMGIYKYAAMFVSVYYQLPHDCVDMLHGEATEWINKSPMFIIM